MDPLAEDNRGMNRQNQYRMRFGAPLERAQSQLISYGDYDNKNASGEIYAAEMSFAPSPNKER